MGSKKNNRGACHGQHLCIFVLSNQLGGHVCWQHSVVGFPNEVLAQEAIEHVASLEPEITMLKPEKLDFRAALNLARFKPAGFRQVAVLNRSNFTEWGWLEPGFVLEEIVPELLFDPEA